MDLQIIAAIVFFLLMGLFLIVKRRNIQIQKILWPVFYFVLYKTKIGIKWMDNIAGRHPRLVRGFGYAGIFAGFLGMIFICYALINNIYLLLFTPAAAPGVGLVLPFKVKGAFYVPFMYWIVSIFFIAAVHEFAHGVVARAHGIKVKSSGVAFLGIVLPVIPAAFVEPDEKQIVKKKASSQLSVFAAGPFSNVLFGIFFLMLLLFVGGPVLDKVLEFDGVLVNGFIPGSDNSSLPAHAAGMSEGEIINSINGESINFLYNFSQLLGDKKPGDSVVIGTDKGEYNITLTSNPEDSQRPYLGVYIQQSSNIRESFVNKYGKGSVSFLLWFFGSPERNGLIFWLYLLNIGIGLFNLVPVGPIDGGRMLNTVLLSRFKKEKATKIFSVVTLFFLALILVNVFSGFFR